MKYWLEHRGEVHGPFKTIEEAEKKLNDLLTPDPTV